MKIVTLATDPNNLGLLLLKFSCEANELDFTALILDETQFRGYRAKDQGLRDYLDELDDDEVIMFTDAYDTILMAGEDEILAKYRAYDRPIVFSAETRSWPDEAMEDLYPKTEGTDYRFLNSGGFVGEVGAIKRLIDYQVETEESRFARSNQYLWVKKYLENQDIIALDTRCELFFTMYPEKDEEIPFGFVQNEYIELVIRKRKWFYTNFEIADNRLRFRPTGVEPCNAHFNGFGKCLMDGPVVNMVLSSLPHRSASVIRKCLVEEPVAVG